MHHHGRHKMKRMIKHPQGRTRQAQEHKLFSMKPNSLVHAAGAKTVVCISQTGVTIAGFVNHVF